MEIDRFKCAAVFENEKKKKTCVINNTNPFS